MSYPAVSDFLTAGEVMELLGGQMRLGLYTKSKNEQAYGQLCKLVAFLEGRKHIYKATD